MRPHFAHYQNDACDVFSEGETAEHLQGKYQLKEWLEAQGFQVELEAYLPQLMQRPDLLVQMGNQPIALEFQCSPISIQKITERTMGYHQAGYQVIWILGNKFPFQKQLTAFQKACLTNLENQLVLFRYSVERERLEYHYNFYLKQNQKMSQSKKVLRHGQNIKFHLNQKTRPPRTPLNMEIEHNKLLRQLQFPSVKSKRFLTTLYEMEETLVSMPKELYTVTPKEWIIQNHPYEWKLLFLLWLETYPLKAILTKKKISEWLDNIHYHSIPQLSEQQKLAPILEYVEVLVESNVLKQIRLDKWSVIDYPKRYKFLEDKFK